MLSVGIGWQVSSRVLSLDCNSKCRNDLGILPMSLVVEQRHAIHDTDEQSAALKTMLVDVTDLWFMTGHMRTSQKAVDAKDWRALILSMPRANSLSSS